MAKHALIQRINGAAAGTGALEARGQNRSVEDELVAHALFGAVFALLRTRLATEPRAFTRV